MPSSDGGLGSALVGEKVVVNHRQVHVSKLLGEGRSCQGRNQSKAPKNRFQQSLPVPLLTLRSSL